MEAYKQEQTNSVGQESSFVSSPDWLIVEIGHKCIRRTFNLPMFSCNSGCNRYDMSGS